MQITGQKKEVIVTVISFHLGYLSNQHEIQHSTARPGGLQLIELGNSAFHGIDFLVLVHS
jgi:hypothetical protein